jgi:hypothetical protein
MINRKLRYLVKWKDFGIEHNSWEPWDNVHAPDLVTEFYQQHPGAARHIRSVNFHAIPFQSNSRVSGRHPFKRGVVVRGLSNSSTPPHFISNSSQARTLQLTRSICAVHTEMRTRKLYVPPPYG